MKVIYYPILVTAMMSLSCSEVKTSDSSNAEEPMEQEVKQSIERFNDEPRVTGIGGVFIKSSNPDSLMVWYNKALGIEMDAYGAVFEFRNANDPNSINYLRWSVFNDSTDYFEPSDQDYMINYRVYDLRGLVDKLQAQGSRIIDSVQSYDYGKFVHLMDPDGNKIELWEPVDSVLQSMGGTTNK